MPNTDRIHIDSSLVNRLVSRQFPQWAHLLVKPVEFGGWDNKTFHLGEQMLVRLPSAARYSSQVKKEHYWLPRLAPFLPLPIPTPLAMGEPGEGYPWNWSVYPWLDGEVVSIDCITDWRQFASTLAKFLISLQKINTADAPRAGRHNFYRGGLLTTYNAEVREATEVLGNKIDALAVSAVWDAALASSWQSPPVWVHGDIAVGNLLVKKGKLSAVIDFGLMGIGDPACDLAIAWTLFKGESRDAFRSSFSFDSATWMRSRGWALWKALCILRVDENNFEAKKVIEELLAD